MATKAYGGAFLSLIFMFTKRERDALAVSALYITLCNFILTVFVSVGRAT